MENKNLTLNQNKIWKLLLCLVVAFLLIEIAYYIFFLNTWFDEANFGYKSWLAAEDLAHPFLDFRSKYPPLAFYLQALFQWLFGPTLLGGRILSALFLAGATAFIFSITKRLAGKWGGLLALALLTFHPYLIGFYSSAKDYSMAIFFPLAALWLLTTQIKTRNKIILASFSMTLGVLIRYNMLPALVGFWLYILWRWRSFRYFAGSLALSIIVFIVGFIPYLILDAEYALIWSVTMFGLLTKLLPTTYFQVFSEFSSDQTSFLSRLNSDYLKLLIETFTKYFHLWLVFLSALLVTVWRVTRERACRFLKENSLLTFFFFLTIIFYASHFLLPSGFNTHPKFLYFAPFLILSVAGSVILFLKHLRQQTSWQSVKLPIICFLVVLVILPTFSVTLAKPYIIFFNHFNLADSDLGRVKKGGEYLASLTQPHDTILAITTPHHPFLAGRYEIPPLINGEFTYYEIDDEELLQRYKFYNFRMLIDWLGNKATVVVFQKDALEESSIFAEENHTKRFMETLNDKYELAGSIANVYPRKYSRSGIMLVYKKKTL